MSNEPQDVSGPTKAPGRNKGMANWSRLLLMLCLIACVTYVAAAALQTMKAKQQGEQSQQAVVASMGLITPTPKSLASKFTDQAGTLLADPPSSADQLIDPDTLVIAHLGNSDEVPAPRGKTSTTTCAQATGKKVTDVIYTGTTDQVSQFASGKITLAAVHPADAPFLVNNYGFHPVAVLGTASGANGNHLISLSPPTAPSPHWPN